MKKMIIAVAVIALAAAMCIPACIFADGSDAACTKTNGSAGISVNIGTSDATEIAKFFPTEYQNDIATGIWLGEFDGLIAAPANFTVSEGKVVEIQKYEVSKGMEIADDYVWEVESTSMITKYTFKATCNANDYAFINPTLGQLIKYLEPTNKTHKDSVLKVTVTVEETTSQVAKNYITKNTNNDYVATKADGEMLNYAKVSAEFTYTYGTVEKSFTYEKTSKMYMKGTAEVDFMDTDPKDATATTYVLVPTSVGDVDNYTEVVVKCDGNTYTNKQDLGGMLSKSELYRYTVLGASNVYTGDLSVPVYKFYGDVLDENAIFNEAIVADTSLQSNDAMKDYLSKNGSIGEDFGASKSTAESMMPGSGSGPNILLFVAIGIGAVVIIAVVVFIFLKKK